MKTQTEGGLTEILSHPGWVNWESYHSLDKTSRSKERKHYKKFPLHGFLVLELIEQLPRNFRNKNTKKNIID